MRRPNRRRFLQTSSAIGASLLNHGHEIIRRGEGRKRSRSYRSGRLNGRGKSHIDGWRQQDNVDIAYVIDPDKKVLEKTLAKLEAKTEGKFTTKGFTDVRHALEDKTLDALSVATPNHWHSLMTIWGAQHGKHVYVEKPMSHDIAEGRAVVAAQKKYGIVIQHGTQRRSNAGIAGLHEALQNGKLPKLKIAYGYCCKPRGSIGSEPIGAPPSNLDWDMWKGPAVIDDYHANYVHYDWHWFWKTGNGDLNNQGTHQHRRCSLGGGQRPNAPSSRNGDRWSIQLG